MFSNTRRSAVSSKLLRDLKYVSLGSANSRSQASQVPATKKALWLGGGRWNSRKKRVGDWCSWGASCAAAASAKASTCKDNSVWSPYHTPLLRIQERIRGFRGSARQHSSVQSHENAEVTSSQDGEQQRMSRAALKVEGALALGDTKLVEKLVRTLPIEDQVYLLKDLYSKQMTADGFARMDKNRDGMVTEDEFERFMKDMNLNKRSRPTKRQLLHVAIASGVPFVGFGMCDNSIMLVAGEAIELNFGMMLGISTMCSAALGNMMSDIFGVGFSRYIEVLAKRLGVKEPLLTPYQMNLRVVRMTSSFGAAFGVTIGCTIGMFPLLFMKDDDDDVKEEEKKAIKA